MTTSGQQLRIFLDTQMLVAELTWVFILLISFLCCLSLFFFVASEGGTAFVNEWNVLHSAQRKLQLISHHYPEPCCAVTLMFYDSFIFRALTFVFSQNMRIASLRCIKTISHFPVHEVKVLNPPFHEFICASVHCCSKYCRPEFYHPLHDIFRCCHFGLECCELWLGHWMTGRDWSGKRLFKPEQSGTLLKSHKGLQSLCSAQMTLSCLPSRFLVGSPGGRWF